MLSGIGDEAELIKHNIPVRKNLPGVGKNLQDHLMCFVGARTKNGLGKNHNLKWYNLVGAVGKYIMSKSGVFSASPLEAVVFESSSLSFDRVDFQLHFAALNAGDNILENDMYDSSTYPKEDGMVILPTLLRPFSRGQINLKSNRIDDKPIIAPNFLSDDRDVQVLLEATKLALKIYQDDVFKNEIEYIQHPHPDSDDQALISHIKDSIETVYHPVGTCKMGNDDMAVVDERLRVHGVGNLRVIDASIMPKIVSGNTNAPTIMIAEKGADLIKEDHK